MKRAALLLGCLLTLSGCSRARNEQAPRCGEVDAGRPVDPPLLAFLSRARAAHHLADDHEADGALGAAITPLSDLVSGPVPRPNGPDLAPEVREVLADTRARLADLRSRQGAFDEALADVRAGLELTREPNYFRGHLLETEGLVEERHAKAVEVSDPGQAATLRKRAIDLLEQAMAVQSQVIQEAPNPGFPAASALPTPAPVGAIRDERSKPANPDPKDQ